MTVLLTLVIFKCMTTLMVLHMSYARTMPDPSAQQAKGRTIHHCPAKCSCFNRTVACNSQQLSRVPNDLPVRTKVLFLNRNIIERIDFRMLSKLVELEELHIQGNLLHGVQREDIGLLPQLRLLDLRDNPVLCDCNLSSLVKSELTENVELVLRLGETLCASPMKHVGKRASDVLHRLRCRGRDRRNAQEECSGFVCHNGGTCVEGEDGPSCQCTEDFIGPRCGRQRPDGECHQLECFNGGTCVQDGSKTVCRCTGSFTGRQCKQCSVDSYSHASDERNDDDDLVFDEEVATDTTIKVSWKARNGMRIGSYNVKYIHGTFSWDTMTSQNYFTFTDLRPNTGYLVCVSAYSSSSSNHCLAAVCQEHRTMPYPGHPEPEPEDPGHHPHPKDPYQEPPGDAEDTIHRAAIILGSVIGICAFLIISLIFGHKLRMLRNDQTHSSDVPPASSTDTTDTSPEPGNVHTPPQEIIVLSVPSHDCASAPPTEEPGAPAAPELASEAMASAPNPITLNSVLEALNQQGTTRSPSGQQGMGSANTVVIYRSDAGTTEEGGASPQENHSGNNTPIYIVSNGSTYPLDSNHILSEVLRSAIAGRGSPQAPIPNEPPPPYKEREDDATPPLVENDGETEYELNENREHDDTSVVQRPEDRS